MKRFLMLAAAVAVASTVGCANARYVQKVGDEGVVAVPVNSDAWPSYNRTSALKLIEQHVGPGYEIVEEREVKTGTATTNTQNTNREQTFNSEVPFLPAERQTTTTTTTAAAITEYHIHYRKRSGGTDRVPGHDAARERDPADRRRGPGRRGGADQRGDTGPTHGAPGRCGADHPGPAIRRAAAAGHVRPRSAVNELPLTRPVGRGIILRPAAGRSAGSRRTGGSARRPPARPPPRPSAATPAGHLCRPQHAWRRRGGVRR